MHLIWVIKKSIPSENLEEITDKEKHFNGTQ